MPIDFNEIFQDIISPSFSILNIHHYNDSNHIIFTNAVNYTWQCMKWSMIIGKFPSGPLYMMNSYDSINAMHGVYGNPQFYVPNADLTTVIRMDNNDAPDNMRECFLNLVCFIHPHGLEMARRLLPENLS